MVEFLSVLFACIPNVIVAISLNVDTNFSLLFVVLIPWLVIIPISAFIGWFIWIQGSMKTIMDVNKFQYWELFKKYWWYWLIHILLLLVIGISFVIKGIDEYNSFPEPLGISFLLGRITDVLEFLFLFLYFGHQFMFVFDSMDHFKVRMMATISKIVSGYSLGCFLLNFMLFVWFTKFGLASTFNTSFYLSYFFDFPLSCGILRGSAQSA